MPLFKVENGRVKQLELTAFRSESELQDLVERNIEEIFGLKFVETEYDIPPFRMDTIAFDEENRSFVIIEYKESEHFSVVDQGVAYLNSLLAHKGEFRLLLERRFDKKMENIDWSQSKVIFVARSFNVYQLGAIAGSLPIELWRYSVFEGRIISLEQLTPPISSLPASSLKGKISSRIEREIKVYTLEDHLLRRNATIKEIFQKLSEEILDMNDQIREKAKKKYVAYELGRNFAELVIQANAIWVYLDVSISRLNDPNKIAEDCTHVGHWGTGDTRFKIKSLSEVPYAVNLIKQAYEKRL